MPRERRRSIYAFQAKSPAKHIHRLQKAKTDQIEIGHPLQILYLGLSASRREDGAVEVGFACHDGTYSIDFAVETIGESSSAGENRDGAPVQPTDYAIEIAEYFVDTVKKYQEAHFYKFVGAGISDELLKLSPQLPSQLWAELDIVPMIFKRLNQPLQEPNQPAVGITVDEISDSMARKCLMFFGPSQQPRVQVGYRNEVEVDSSGHSRMSSVEQYRQIVGPQTWDALMKYVESLKERNIKIAFFNSTPQGGGVALMRHALIRFFRELGVSCRWFVPKPKPEVFRITKTNHNILQGVSAPEERLTSDQAQTLEDWAFQNASHFWTNDGGPLASRSKGGADIIIVDDPQMPSLITEAKRSDPDRPVIFRSHIQVRADLANKPDTPTAEVWDWVWKSVKAADLFISHPVREFVPSSVNVNTVGYMPATTDWLDGLNKELNEYDTAYYIHEFNSECWKNRMNTLAFPKRPYIIQIARFDPAKGIPDVLAAYAEFRRKYASSLCKEETPQLVIAGHGAVDDPDGSRIYDETIGALEKQYSDVKDDVVVMRLGPTDQLLNALMSNAKVALQLSTREGFEVKVSEALHKGTPIIATRAGGIPLQVQHEKSGFLVEPSDSSAVAKYLHTLFSDEAVYNQMSEFAASHVSDEVSTVGNALAWLYLADTMTKGEKVEPNSRWINDMAREAAGKPYDDNETRLPRNESLDLNK